MRRKRRPHDSKKGDLMATSNTKSNEDGPAKARSVETTVCKIEVFDLFVEELEAVIAPKLAANHNETMVDDGAEIELQAEDLEEVIAPRLSSNHNETILSDS